MLQLKSKQSITRALVIEDCLAEELCYVRNPYTACTDINPHSLDRIAHVQNVLGVQGKGLNNSGQNVHNRDRYAIGTTQQKFDLRLLLISEIRGEVIIQAVAGFLMTSSS